MNDLGFDVEEYLEELSIKEPKEKAHALKHMGMKPRRLKGKALREYHKNRQLYYIGYSRRSRGDN